MPKDWRELTLGDVAQYINGRAFKPSEWKRIGLPIVRIQNLNDPLKPFNYFDGECEQRYYINNGDILISWSASLGVYVWDRGPAILNQHIFRVLPNESIVDRRYFVYAIQTILEEMKSRVHGSTMRHIVKSDFQSLKIPIPPLTVQRRIADVLDRGKQLQRLREETNQLTSKLTQSVFLKMFGDPINNTKRYDLTKLPDVAKLERGRFGHRPRTEPRFYGGKYPFIQIGDLPRDRIYIRAYTQTLNEKGLAISRLFPRGTIVIAIAATIGEVGILDFDSCFPDSLVGITPNQSLLTPEYLYFFLVSIKKRLTELAPLTAQRNINLRILSQVEVPVPPIDQQRRFSDFIDKAEKMRMKQETSTAEINELFRSLMQRAFRGELR